ncbi:MAG: ribose 5-phosphate isomerase B [Ruminococcus sp.]|nr:ribose 5-phosphate isomerase B [Ruminococcus sp.]
MMKIAIGNDHAAPQLKKVVMDHLEENGFDVIDVGCAEGEKCDYPDSARKVCDLIRGGEAGLGILICGTGVGMSLAANKFKGIRAACCSETFSARLTREHNDANVLCMGARVIGEGTALDIVDSFVNTPFSGDERHVRRIALINAIEQVELSAEE